MTFPHGSSAGDSTFVPLAISLAAFVMSCITLFGLAMSESASLVQAAAAIAVIAAMGAASWRLRRAHRRELHRSEVRSADAPPTVFAQRFSELRTTACRAEPSAGGKAFAVRCFRTDCTSSPTCPGKDNGQPAAHRT